MKLLLKNKRVMVLGLGETGLSALRWLQTKGAILSVADSRENPPNLDDLARSYPHVAVHTGAFKPQTLLQAELIVISPGVALKEPAVQAAIQAGIPVIGDIELFAQYRPKSAIVIAITGSNGKTTVTSLVGEICKQAGLNTVVAGNIGLPVLDALLASELNNELPDIYVLELSSFQLETTSSLICNAATVLNISEDHMDRYDSIADYAAAKARILAHATVAVLNRDDAVSMAMRSTNVVTFGLNAAPNVQDIGLVENGQQWLASGQRKLLAVSELKITGQHNIANAMAAILLCHAVGIDKVAIIEALRQFKGLPHRVEWVANIDDVDYYDDSKGTNVGATCAAILGMTKNSDGQQVPQKVVLIAGGEGKDQDFTPLATAVKTNARAVVLIGRDAMLIEAVLLPTDIALYHAADMPEAVNIAKKVAKKGDAVLLSPACASFDMFKNYVHRAEVFVKAVECLARENALDHKKVARC
jgi:UDP-N-acetylmuramoylalanine--D-glutamate ligase